MQGLAVAPDGRTLYVSRGFLGDVAAFDLGSRRLLWRLQVEGLRADHIGLSPDGRRLFVSALTANKVEAIDTATHAVAGSFATGDWPHVVEFTPDGRYVVNGSLVHNVEDEHFVFMCTNADYVSFYIGHSAGDPPPIAPRYEFMEALRRLADTGGQGKGDRPAARRRVALDRHRQPPGPAPRPQHAPGGHQVPAALHSAIRRALPRGPRRERRRRRGPVGR